MRYVIVGNSAAAVGAVEGIRGADGAGEVTLLAREREHTYSRPLLSYLLAGKVSEDRMRYRPAEFYRENGVEARLGEEVVAVNPSARTVTTGSGGQVEYDRLLLATGGSPVLPQIEGLDAPGVFTFTSCEDARQVGAWIGTREVTSAVVLGGGMIGLKAAEALIERGLRVTIVELADRLLSGAFDRTASEIVEGALANRGAAVRLRSTVAKVLVGAGGALDGVRLTGGEEIRCRLLLVAIGVAPNIGYLEGSGIETRRGIVVDGRLRTSAADVYAAGDVTETWDVLLERHRPIPILPLAYRQGLIAGRNMAGRSESCPGGMAMNSVEICGVPTISVGIAGADGDGYEVLSSLDAQKASYRKVVLRAGRMVGAILVGEIDRAGIFTGLIEHGVDVGDIRHLLLSEKFGLLSLDAGYRKHMVHGPGIEV